VKVELAILFVTAAGALAIWIDVRAAAIRPETLSPTLVHLFVAASINALVAPLMGGWLASSGLPLGRLGAIVAIALPALVYVALAALWLLRLVQSMMPRAYR